MCGWTKSCTTFACYITCSKPRTPHVTLVRKLGKQVYEWPKSCTTQTFLDVNSIKKGVRGFAFKMKPGLSLGGASFRPSTGRPLGLVNEGDPMSDQKAAIMAFRTLPHQDLNGEVSTTKTRILFKGWKQ